MISHSDRIRWGKSGAAARWGGRDEFIKRFLARVKIGLKSECWLWMGPITKSGYGKVKYQGKHLLAHRVAFEIAYGTPPDGVYVCHHCDNPPCCNPSHLFPGTPMDNAQDALKKGRLKRQPGWVSPMLGKPGKRGEDNPMHKLSDDNIKSIHKMWIEDGMTQTEIARRFRVGQDHISRIVNGKRWAHQST